MPTAALKAFLFFLSSSRGNLSTIFCCSDKEPQNKFRTKTFRPKKKKIKRWKIFFRIRNQPCPSFLQWTEFFTGISCPGRTAVLDCTWSQEYVVRLVRQALWVVRAEILSHPIYRQAAGTEGERGREEAAKKALERETKLSKMEQNKQTPNQSASSARLLKCVNNPRDALCQMPSSRWSWLGARGNSTSASGW